MAPRKDVTDLPPLSTSTPFLDQLESLMRHELFDDVPAASFLDELEAAMRHELFSDLPAATQENEHHTLGTGPKYCSYKPLAGNGYIRLLSLAPGKKTDGLKGSLLHVHIKINHDYEALSYAWGSKDKPYCITLADGILKITKSLYTGLVRLRRREKRRLLWIDALCINQDDNMERNQQVLLMRQIYSSASRVLVWLGEDEGNSGVALHLLEEIGKVDFSSLPGRSISAEWMKANNLPGAGAPAWVALLAFWRRPWFRRVWIVQEFVLAKDALMICGDSEVSWKAFTSAHEKMMQHSLLDWGTLKASVIEDEKNEAFGGSMSLLMMMEIKHGSRPSSSIANAARSFIERDASGLQELQEGSWGQIPFFKELVMGLRGTPNLTGPMTQLLEQNIEAFTQRLDKPSFEFRLPLIHLLTVFDKSEASDDKDRLFGFLGLASDGNERSLRPDYDEPIELILLRFAKYFVGNGAGMRLLHEAGISKRETPIPSWVPDWTQTGRLEKKSLATIASTGLIYKAAANTAPQIRVADDNESEILVSGGYVDTVSRTASHEQRNWETGPEYFRGLRNIFEEADSFILNRRKAYVTGEPLSEVRWRTLIGNWGEGLAATEEFGRQYDFCRQILESAKPGSPFFHIDSLNSYSKRFVQVAMAYKLCETRTGLVGMVPFETRVGDSIYVFTGGAMPLVLRPGAGLESKYQLVGGCYIHGIMNGEAMLSESWKEEDVIIQ